MVSKQSVEKQLKDLKFNVLGWGHGEVDQLPHIILPDEQIYEVVNGLYEGGFALLLATDIRVLLVDKKPMNFLTVEDLRFDMINEIDYNHRMFGAYITITTGNKVLSFRSYNKERLRKLIGHVQHCMAETKKQQSTHAEGQSEHLEKINDQLQAYLMAQYKQQQKLQDHLTRLQSGVASNVPQITEPVMPSPELADYLYSRGLLEKYQRETGKNLATGPPAPARPPAGYTQVSQANDVPDVPTAPASQPSTARSDSQLDEIYADGIKEVFGKNPQSPDPAAAPTAPATSSLEVNPFRIAFSKLPMALRNRKFGLGSLSKPALRPPMPSRPRPPKPEPAR